MANITDNRIQLDPDNPAGRGQDESRYNLAAQELERHLEDVEISKTAHFIMADHYSQRETLVYFVSAVSFVGIVVFWFISTQIYFLIEAFGGSVAEGWKLATQNVIPIAFATANMVATAIHYTFRFDQSARRNRESAQRYHRLFRRLKNWKTDCPDVHFIEQLIRQAAIYREEISELNHCSPDIEEWAWKLVDPMLKKGGTVYDVDPK